MKQNKILNKNMIQSIKNKQTQAKLTPNKINQTKTKTKTKNITKTMQFGYLILNHSNICAIFATLILFNA